MGGTPEAIAQEMFEKGVEFQQRGLIDNALEEYDKALQLQPDNLDILLNLGAACLQKGLSERAKKLLLQVLNRQPKNTMALFNLGKTFLYREEYKEAASIFEEASAMLPEDVEIKKMLGFCYKRLNNTEKAVEILQSLKDKLYDDFDMLMQLGSDLKSLERYPEAIEMFKKASALNCSSVAPLMGVFESHAALGSPDKAITALKRAIMIEPTNQELLIKLADACLADGRVQEAVDVIKKGIETIDKPTLLSEKYGEMARRLPILQKKATAKFNAGLSKYEIDIYDILDALYDGKIELKAALEKIEAIYKKAPNDTLASEEFANLLFQARNFSRAAEIYSALLISKPTEHRYRIDVVKSLAMSGDAEAARAMLKASIKSLGHSTELDLAMVELDLFDKNFEAAFISLEEILTKSPKELHALFLYAYTSLRLNKLKASEEAFKTLFDTGAADEELAVWYSKLAILLSKPQDALKVWNGLNDGIETLVEIIARVELTLAMGQSKSLLRLLKKVGAYQPRFLEDRVLFGKAFFFSGDFALAQRELEIVVKYEPNNAEVWAMSALAWLIRNKSAPFWNCWQRAVECDSLHAVVSAMILKDSLNFSQKERLKSETIKMLDSATLTKYDKVRLKKLLEQL